MSHSHSQIMALPVVPPTVSSRLDGTKSYFEETGKCCLCEAKSKHFVIDESSHFVSVAPYAATYPFEVWIVPKDHSSHFHHLDDVKVAFFIAAKLHFLDCHLTLVLVTYRMLILEDF